MIELYTVSTMSVDSILANINSGEIAIPEIQRPFVWKTKQVRDLVDSLFIGYPTGYLIISQNPDMKLKDGSLSVGKKIMIDGQQRTTALMTALAGKEVIMEDFSKKRIKIAFNPLLPLDSEEERFKVLDNAVLKDKRWIPDIAEVFKPGFSEFTFINKYLKDNPGVSDEVISEAMGRLRNIRTCQVGLITLNKDLTIDQVTDIFIRINNQGTKLNQADFAMSRIAANAAYGGNELRKAIDYFSHLAVQPEWYSDMCNDIEFTKTDYFKKVEWLKDDNDDIFDVDYNDILRIAFMYKFGRGKMKDLVSLLSGRDFITREYKESIAEESFAKLKEGTLALMNKYSYKNFILAIRSAGFVAKSLINSDMTLDFAYTLYLLLHEDASMDSKTIDEYIIKWYVLSTLTSRYITSPESVMDYDLRSIKQKGFVQFFTEVEMAVLSETYWNIGLVQNLETSATNSPYFNVFLAAQIRENDYALFSKGTTIRDLITNLGEVHHIFPKEYLKKHGWSAKSQYNQIANFTYLDTQVNKDISDKAPSTYFTEAINACEKGEAAYGNIKDRVSLENNIAQNAVPAQITSMSSQDYPEFLRQRRVLMAKKIHDYYCNL